VLTDAETELQDTLIGMRSSAADFVAGRWTTPEDLDATMTNAAQQKLIPHPAL
jgi:hypothetical protein